MAAKERKVIILMEIEKSTSSIRKHLENTLIKKGDRAFASIHEILGIISEEFRELEDAIHRNDYQLIEKELEDLGAMAIFSHACLINNKLDW